MIDFLLASLYALPFATAAIFALALWFKVGLHERWFAQLTSFTFAGTAMASAALIYIVFTQDGAPIVRHVGDWFSVGHYRFDWVTIADGLSLGFSVFVSLLLGLIGAFSRRYLHRESGYFRFFFFLVLFGGSVELIVVAGGLDLVFVGWELVGLTSAMLIAFFVERKKPVEHGLRAFITYRFCDIGLLMATVWLHHAVAGGGNMHVSSEYPWMVLSTPTNAIDATAIGFLLLWATMGKSAQVPFGGWLPRAMEGPTPSSAIFYGALSVHLGPFLLLRAMPIIDSNLVISALVILVGLITTVHATVVGSVQTDIKSALGYASMMQVGIIFIEIGLGLEYIALVHIIGHASLRSLQILRSPSLLADQQKLAQAMGGVLPRTGTHFERRVPKRLQPWLYRHALERGYWDAVLEHRVIASIVRLLRAFDKFDLAWIEWIARVTGPNGENKSAHSGEHDPQQRQS